MSNPPPLQARGLAKTFVLHQQNGTRLHVLDDVSFDVQAGDCIVLSGNSGSGKSTLLRCLYANYRPQQGSVQVTHGARIIDILAARPHDVLAIRRHTLGYVSQFLRVIPRVPTLDIVADPLRQRGIPVDEARERAARLLSRVNIPERLWSLAPGTFSGGEQQRVNIARCFVADNPILLLDEPTASLDQDNRDVVIELILEARDRGVAMVGIFHDAATRERVASHYYDMQGARVHSVSVNQAAL